jgi:hypothetical protein
MGTFANNPDYELRWPPAIFESELRRLIAEGRRTGYDSEWDRSVEWLLRQAFGEGPAVTEFTRTKDWVLDEEPF